MSSGTGKIDMMAQKLLAKTQLSSPPVDLYRIADFLDLEVHYDELDDDVSGFLMTSGDHSVIMINELHHPNRQRFTLAHEIGHFVLHSEGKTENLFIDKKYSIYHRDTNSSSGMLKMEREANRFAAELLMPQAMLEAEIEKNGMDLIDDADSYLLAKKFGVSEQALGFRLARLNYEVGQF